MLPKKYRLRLEKDFDKIFKQGRFVGGNLFTLGYAPNKLDFSRFAVVVSKKVSNKAVARNLAKRRSSEAIRLAKKNIKSGYDFVFIAKPGANGKAYKEIEQELIGLFKKTKLFFEA